jgi:hypothetical protein
MLVCTVVTFPDEWKKNLDNGKRFACAVGGDVVGQAG